MHRQAVVVAVDTGDGVGDDIVVVAFDIAVVVGIDRDGLSLIPVACGEGQLANVGAKFAN